MPDPAPPPESADDMLAAALAALTEAGIPPDGEYFAVPDPDSGCPPEYADLTSAELDELIAASPEPVPDIGPAGAIPRDRTALPGDGAPGDALPGGAAGPEGPGPGMPRAGFGQDGILDLLAPGVPLAGFADDAHHQIGALTDDELVGVLRAWRRQTSWAQARELAAIAELARRRPADRTPPPAPGRFPAKISEFTADEIGMALTLTRVGAAGQLDLALALARWPATAAALEAGRIDLYKATLILDMITLLSPEHAAAVEAKVLPEAEGQTSGQLRAAIRRLVLLLDPGAMRRRREEAQQGARVECWTDPEGTASLAGRWLPPAEVVAADKRLCQVAAWWKKQIRAAWKQADPDGEIPRPEHGTDLLRARAYLALLLGQPVDTAPADLLPAPSTPDPSTPDPSTPDPSTPDPSTPDPSEPASTGPAPGPGGTPSPDAPPAPAAPGGTLSADGQQLPAGLRRPGPAPAAAAWRGDPVAALPPLAGTVNLTLPLATLLGLADRPGDVAGYGPLHGDIVRDLANAAAGHPATSWGLIITDPHGQAVGYGYAPRAKPIRGHPADGWTITLTTQRIATSAPP